MDPTCLDFQPRSSCYRTTPRCQASIFELWITRYFCVTSLFSICLPQAVLCQTATQLSSCGQWHPWWEQRSAFLLVCVLFQVVCFCLMCASLQVNQSLILQRKEGPDKQWLLRGSQVSPCYRVHWKIHHMENTRRSTGLALWSSCVEWMFLAVAAVKFISKCIVHVSEYGFWVK